jgi:hypothetical protein
MICANNECKIEFISRTHNQKYCSDECCRIATNKRIMDKYYEKKAIKKGALRNCKKCKSELSRYNTEEICSSCSKTNYTKTKKMISDIINEIS